MKKKLCLVAMLCVLLVLMGIVLAACSGVTIEQDPETGLVTVRGAKSASNGEGGKPNQNPSETTPTRYNVTLTLSNSAAGTVTGGGAYESGAYVTVTATANEGFNFLGWYLNDSEMTTDTSYTFQMPEQDMALTAKFEVVVITSFAVSATADPEGACTFSGTGTYEKGTIVTVSATPSAGYEFLGWYDGNVLLSGNAGYTFIMPAKAVALTAKFQALEPVYAVTLTADPEGACTFSGAGTYENGALVRVSAVAAEGYTFLGWYYGETNVSTSAAYAFMMPAQDMPLTARFEEVPAATYTLTLLSNYAGAGSLIGAGSYEAGASVEISATPAEGYNFVGWYRGEDWLTNDSTYTFTMPDHNVTYDARFEYATQVSEECEFTFDLTELDPRKSIVVFQYIDGEDEFVTAMPCGTTHTYSFQAGERYIIASYLDLDAITFTGTIGGYAYEDAEVSTTTIFAETAVCLKMPNDQYDFQYLDFCIGDHGTFTFTEDDNYGYLTINNEDGPSSVSMFAVNSYMCPGVDAGEEDMFDVYDEEYRISVNGGYATAVFSGIYGGKRYDNVELTVFCRRIYAPDGNDTWNFELRDDGILTVSTNENPTLYTVTLTPYPAGTSVMLIGAGQYEPGAPVELHIMGGLGSFMGWYEGETLLSSDSNYYFTMPERDLTLTAKYAAPSAHTVTVTVTPEGAGTVSFMNGSSYQPGAMVTVWESPKVGYNFLGWYDSSDKELSTSMSYSFAMPNCDVNIIAKYEISTVLTLIAEPAEGGTVTGAGAFAPGTWCTIEATPAEGFRFVGWFQNDALIEDVVSYSFQMPENSVTYTAMFETIGSEPSIRAGYLSINNTNGSGTVTVQRETEKDHYIDDLTVSKNGIDSFEFNDEEDYYISSDGYMTATFRGTYDKVKYNGFALTIVDGLIYSPTGHTWWNFQEGDGGLVTVREFDALGEFTIDEDDCSVYVFDVWDLYKSKNITIMEVGTDNTTNISADQESESFVFDNNKTYILGSYDQLVEARFTGIINGHYCVNMEILTTGTMDDFEAWTYFSEDEYRINFQPGYTGTFILKDKVIPPETPRALMHIDNTEGDHGITVSHREDKNDVEDGVISAGGTDEFDIYHNEYTLYIDGYAAVVFNGTYCNVPYTNKQLIVNGGIIYSPLEDSWWQFERNDGEVFLTITYAEEPPVSTPYTLTLWYESTTPVMLFGGGRYEAGAPVSVSYILSGSGSFIGWYEGETLLSSDSNYSFTMPERNVTLTARFNAVTHTLTVNASPSEGGTVSGGGAYVNGHLCCLLATAAPGYRFVEWRDPNDKYYSQTYMTSYTMQNWDMTFTAIFEPMGTEYEVSVLASPVEGGTVTGGGSYLSGTGVTIEAIPAEGYTFSGWRDSNNNSISGAGMTYSFTMPESHVSYTAVFKAAPVATYKLYLTASPAEGGTVSGAGGYHTQGESITIVATPSEGYTFSGWYNNGDRVSSSSEYTFKMPGDNVSYTAVFEIVQPTMYMVELTADPVEGGTVTGAGDYAPGASVTIVATPSEGYSFYAWYNGSSYVSGSSEYTFEISDDVSYIAVFEEDEEPSDPQEVVININNNTDDISAVVWHYDDKWDVEDITISANDSQQFTFGDIEYRIKLSWFATVTYTGTYGGVEYFNEPLIVDSMRDVNPPAGGFRWEFSEGDTGTITITPLADPYYTVKVTTNLEGVDILAGTGIYERGNTYTIPLLWPAPEGMEFLGWYDENNSLIGDSPAMPYYFTMPSHNVVITGRFEPITE